MAYDFDALIAPIARQLQQYQDQGLKIFSTSSFQPQSLPLLHILSRLAPDMPIYFLDTGYHFPETLAYRDTLSTQLGINLQIASPLTTPQQQQVDGTPLHAVDADRCCHVNKVEPMDAVLQQYDVWVNGIRRGQSSVRAGMQTEEQSKFGVLRYHPMLEWDSRMVFSYIHAYQLPLHPLASQGYMSIGCAPCTAPSMMGQQPEALDDRSGRWAGQQKTECGLHTTLGKHA